MRYHSLRFVSLLYKLTGIAGGIASIILFLLVAATGISFAQILGLGVGAPVTASGYIASLFPAFIILISGLIGGITSYAIGAFIMLMIDIEQGIRNIDQHFNRIDYPEDIDPLTPKPWASFPQSRWSLPPRPAGDERSQIPRGKWDMGNRR